MNYHKFSQYIKQEICRFIKKPSIVESGAGFTLIELMVSIAVITIVSSFVMTGKNGEEQKMFLRTTAFTLSQNLREYQEKALSGENVDCPNPSFQICGFGAHFEKGDNFFTYFIDCSNDCGNSNHKLTENDLELDIALGTKVKICDVPNNKLDVVFAPPDPIIYLDNSSWGSEVEITLCLKANNTITKKVILNNAGKIEIQ